MKCIIAGSRDITDCGLVEKAIADSGFEITEVVSGTARGVDRLGERWAREHRIPIKRMPADWKGSGKRAGYYRNEGMAMYADALVAVWDFKSRGTQHMIDIAKRKGLKVYVPRSIGGQVSRSVDDRGYDVLHIKGEGFTVTLRHVPKGSGLTVEDRQDNSEVVIVTPEGEKRHLYNAASLHQRQGVSEAWPYLRPFWEYVCAWMQDVGRPLPDLEPFRYPTQSDPEEWLSREAILFACGREEPNGKQRNALRDICQKFNLGRCCFPVHRIGSNPARSTLHWFYQGKQYLCCDGLSEIRDDQIWFRTRDEEFPIAGVCAFMPEGVDPMKAFRSPRMLEYMKRVPVWWLNTDGSWFQIPDGRDIVAAANRPDPMKRFVDISELT